MIITNIQLAIRHLLKRKTYAFINIFGLALGIAAALLIFRVVQYELSYDTWHTHYDHIGRVITEDTDRNGGFVGLSSGIPIPAMDVMEQQVTPFEHMARLHYTWPMITVPDASGNARLKFNTDSETQVGVYTEPSFFSIFDWTWLAGDAQSALTQPNSAVINQSTAERCFGNWRDALGKTLKIDTDLLVQVRAVVADAPENTDFPFFIFISYETLRSNPALYGSDTSWGTNSSNDQVYAKIHPESSIAEADKLLAQVGKEEYNKGVIHHRHLLQPLSEQHFSTDMGAPSSKGRLWALAMIGLLIVTMACFNFINLATAMAASRSKEVGVRKTLGSSRQQLIRQFLSETMVIVGLAVAMGATLAYLLLPALSLVSSTPSHWPFLSHPAILGFLALITTLVALLSGLYPAVMMANFKPVQALKNNLNSRSIAGVSLRKVLVLTQFTIAQALIIGTLITLSQMEYIRTLDLGFNPNLVYTLNMSPDSAHLSRFDAFKNELLMLPAVEQVSLSSDQPSSLNTWSSNFAYNNNDDAPFSIQLKLADVDYFDTYQLRFAAGQAFAPSDTARQIVVNETTLRKLGVQNPQEAIGKNVRIGGGPWLPIVGVVQDFKPSSVHSDLQPLAIYPQSTRYYSAGIKIKPEKMAGAVEAIQKVYESAFPDLVFEGSYYDESIANFYRAENRFANLSKAFAILAILISCLGLYGLSSLMAVQRTKEIGIRKVLGASVAGITGLLAKDFLQLVLLAFVLASPLAWYLMDHWLADFVYRINMGVGTFVLAGLLALLVAFVTVSFQSIKAAWANPVKSLRSE